VHDRTHALNRHRAALDLVFPELLSVLRLPDSPTLVALLAAYLTAAAVAGAAPADVRRLVRETSRAHPGDRCVDALIAAARTSVALQAGEAALALKARALVWHLLILDRELAELAHASPCCVLGSARPPGRGASGAAAGGAGRGGARRSRDVHATFTGVPRPVRARVGH
jgi:hypothetical protein